MWDDLREKIGRRIAKTVVTRAHAFAFDRPVVSFTFDDVPDTAATTGAGILEQHGVRGSFYACGGLAGSEWELYRLAGLDRIAELAARGHEIGCHTAGHERLGPMSRAAYLRDCTANAAILAPIVGDGGLRTFAYPFGHVRIDLKLALQRRFRACRGIHDGLNLGTLDLGRLRADPLEGASAHAPRIDALLDETARQRGWRIFYSHDVCDAPTRFGVTPGLLAHAVAGALRRGCAVIPVVAALDAAGVP